MKKKEAEVDTLNIQVVNELKAQLRKETQKLGRVRFKKKCAHFFTFFSIRLTHEGSHREVYRDFQPSLTSSAAGGAKGCSDHRFHAPSGYAA